MATDRKAQNCPPERGNVLDSLPYRHIRAEHRFRFKTHSGCRNIVSRFWQVLYRSSRYTRI